MIERAPPAATGNWTAEREKLRGIIRTEVAKFGPTEDARHPLELIVETSVRYEEVDGETRITVVDEAGRPRMTEKDGETVPFSLQDLIAELRRDHPILFRPPTKPHAEDAVEGSSASTKTRRDWLDIGSKELRSGRAHRVLLARMPWSRKHPAANRNEESAAASPDRTNQPSDILDLDKEHRRWSLPRAAAGAAAMAAVLFVGTIALLKEDTTLEEPEGPAITGTVTSAQTEPAPQPPVAAPARRTLRGVPEVLDTATLSLEGEVVRLFGVEWAPGAGKPDDLIRYLQNREVECEPAGPNDIYRCKVGGQDLSRVVLFNGGGKATPEATAELKAAADKAREARVGVWQQ